MKPPVLLSAALLASFAALLGAGAGSAPAAPERKAAGIAAFNAAYPVLMHPRCLNCHPAGDQPLVGDDARPHPQRIRRGLDGLGLAPNRCFACHQDRNLALPHQPPGAPFWRLSAKAAPLTFQGRTAAQLCRQLQDPRQNGGRSPAQLAAHVRTDELVAWGWAPGPGRAPVPGTQAAFADQIDRWIAAGMPCPE